MKIALFTDSYVPRRDGIAIITDSQRRALEQLGHEVWVVCPTRPEADYADDPHVLALSAKPSRLYEGYQTAKPPFRPLLRRLRTLGIDVVHSSSQSHVGILAAYFARKASIPLVTTVWSDYRLGRVYPRLVPLMLAASMALSVATGRSPVKYFRRAFSAKAGTWSERISFAYGIFYDAQCDSVIVPSLRVANDLKAFGERQKLTVIPAGFDFGLLDSLSRKSRDLIRATLGLREADVAVVSSSRLVPEKAIDVVIAAFGNTAKEIKALHLVIIGDGPERARLQTQANSLGEVAKRVHFLGNLSREEVVATVAACDIFGHAAKYETQGMVLNESAAVGVPIVMVDHEVSEMVIDGETGLFATDTATFSAHLKALASSSKLRHEMSKAIRARALQLDSVGQTKKIVTLYKDVIAGSV